MGLECQVAFLTRGFFIITARTAKRLWLYNRSAAVATAGFGRLPYRALMAPLDACEQMVAAFAARLKAAGMYHEGKIGHGKPCSCNLLPCSALCLTASAFRLACRHACTEALPQGQEVGCASGRGHVVTTV